MRIRDMIPLPYVSVIFDTPFVDNRYHSVLVEDRGTMYSPDPNLSVVFDVVQVSLFDYYSMFEVSISLDVEIYPRYIDVLDYDRSWSPTAVTVVGLTRSQGYPTDVDTEVYPGYSPRIPGKSDINVRATNVNPDVTHGRGPIPMTSHEYPAAVVVSYVSKWLVRNPGVVPIPDDPSACGKWCPSNADIKGTPEIVVCPVVIDSFPPAMLFQDVSVMMQHWREIFYRFSLYPHPFGPQSVSLPVPRMPIRVRMSLSGCNLPIVRED
jgi:hypothetical protein